MHCVIHGHKHAECPDSDRDQEKEGAFHAQEHQDMLHRSQHAHRPGGLTMPAGDRTHSRGGAAKQQAVPAATAILFT
jgi:hypothetical protein